MATLFLRLLRDDEAQDVVEYALLTAAIGLAGIATWPLIAVSIGAAYQNFDTQSKDLWIVPDPWEGDVPAGDVSSGRPTRRVRPRPR